MRDSASHEPPESAISIELVTPQLARIPKIKKRNITIILKFEIDVKCVQIRYKSSLFCGTKLCQVYCKCNFKSSLDFIVKFTYYFMKTRLGCRLLESDE